MIGVDLSLDIEMWAEAGPPPFMIPLVIILIEIRIVEGVLIERGIAMEAERQLKGLQASSMIMEDRLMT